MEISQNFVAFSEYMNFTVSMGLYHKWDVKNGFAYVFQFFSLISDGLGGVHRVVWELRMEPAGLYPLSPYSAIVRCLDLKRLKIRMQL